MKTTSSWKTWTVSPRTAITVLGVIILLLSAFAVYGYSQVIELRSSNQSIVSSLDSRQSVISSLSSRLGSYNESVSSLEAQLASVQRAVLSAPCAERPAKQTTESKAYTNGTEIVKFSYPVLALAAGSLGTICVSYHNGPTADPWSGFAYTPFDPKNGTLPARGISITDNSSNLSIPPGHDSTVVYVIRASSANPSSPTTKFYGLKMSRYPCGAYPLIVSSNDTPIADFSDFPGLLNTIYIGGLSYCEWWTQGTLLGFNGLSTVYLRNTTKVAIGYNITSRSVTSIIQSPARQNITFTVGIQSFSFPITVWFATGLTSYIRMFKGNPEVKPSPGNACDWSITNSSAYDEGNFQEFGLPAPGFTVSAPTLHLPPYSQGTFRFSMLVENLTKGYYVAFLGFVITWKNSPGINTHPDLGTYFPISVGSGQWNQDIVNSTCPSH